MEPKRIEVVAERWTCWNPEHKHLTHEKAMRCMAWHEAAERRRAETPARPKYSTEAMEWMRFKREDGMRICDIAKRLGVSTPRAQQLCAKAKAEHDKRMRAELHLLPLLRMMCSNVEFSGGAPLHGAASAGTQC